MKMSMQEINRNFLIRMITFDERGRHISRLVGYSTVVNLIGQDMLHKMVRRAYENGQDKTRCKLRRGLMIDLYSR